MWWVRGFGADVVILVVDALEEGSERGERVEL